MSAYIDLLYAIARGSVEVIPSLVAETGMSWTAVRELSEISYAAGGRDKAAKAVAMAIADAQAWQAPRHSTQPRRIARSRTIQLSAA